ncbi:phosphoribosylanthranilate isomerase [Metabacillus halosaccharovorans]|uniref:N-(5'-phosphoribosyl)anthranilate isomerase n=1 Tax=Metabacillus halosaccharovorans TaxID=930124 RepID=A0ABT3DN82_9BACI|nr:phosphoribosylanthranilate isomerase [Metabacillus halosaccharovorans]MCV9888354.1 phosphoribosylanthranilate isomerase [Metabacillus halosaccharovorans]
MNKPIIKFCGVQSLNDLKVVCHSLADYIGFIFAESKRKVDPLLVAEWLKEVDTTKKVVAVFVNPIDEEIENVLKHVPVDVIQFHGNETIDQIRRIGHSFDGQLWKALHHHDKTIDEMEHYHSVIDGFVIDSRTKGQWGGTGVRFDWDAVPKYIDLTNRLKKLCLIAGGVNEKNISELLSLHPQGIDLSSGIEKDQKKSSEKVNKIEERVLQYVNISR